MYKNAILKMEKGINISWQMSFYRSEKGILNF